MTEEILLWCDLETTGLKERTGHILEAGFELTSLYMERSWWSFSCVMAFPASKWRGLDSYIRTMHADLLPQCDQSKMAPSDTEALVINLLSQRLTGNTTTDPKIKLAGSSVHFDRDWLRVHMPNLAKFLGYQLLDVSAYYPVLRKHGLYPEMGRAHRVRGDLDFSQECYRRVLSLEAPK